MAALHISLAGLDGALVKRDGELSLALWNVLLLSFCDLDSVETAF